MMEKRNFGVLLGAALALSAVVASPGQAAKFANQFTEFELPPQWGCNLEGAEWVCQSTNDSKKRDAIIVLAAKIKNDQDTLPAYLSYLKAAKTFTSAAGKPVKSEPKYAKEVNINGQPWVDALHLESEIPGFYSRYLATVKQDIGVLISMNVSKAKYQDYLNDFDNMVKSIKVFRQQGAPITAAPPNANLFNQVNIPQGDVNAGSVFGNATPQGGAAQPKPVQQKEQSPLLLLLAAAGAVGFIIWKKKRQSED